jgi:hypothetical protein
MNKPRNSVTFKKSAGEKMQIGQINTFHLNRVILSHLRLSVECYSLSFPSIDIRIVPLILVSNSVRSPWHSGRPIRRVVRFVASESVRALTRNAQSLALALSLSLVILTRVS